MHATKLAALALGGMSLAMLGGCNESAAEPAAQVARADAPKRAREVCTDETVTVQKEVKDKNRILGTVAGALVGGVIGDKVGGKGTGGDIATVGGAAAGGYAGNRVQKSVQKGATETVTQRVCRTVYE